MITIVSGAASSGKSQYAEDLAMSLSQNRYYLATMRCFDIEANAKKDAHIKKRENKNFSTIEQYKNIDEVDVLKNSVILLECLSNLLANESYEDDAQNKEDPAKKIIADVLALADKCENLVIVSNEIFSDGVLYDEFTVNYINNLGRINRAIAKVSDIVVEVVVGIPIIHKGESICSFSNH